MSTANDDELSSYDELNCPNCDTLCKPVKVLHTGTVMYNRHKCQTEYEFMPKVRSFSIDIQGDLVGRRW